MASTLIERSNSIKSDSSSTLLERSDSISSDISSYSYVSCKSKSSSISNSNKSKSNISSKSDITSSKSISSKSSISSKITKSSSTVISISTTDENQDIKKKPPKSLGYRIFKVFAWIIAIIITLFIFYVVINVLCHRNDSITLDEYNRSKTTKIDIKGHDMSYSIIGDSHNATTIVSLPGLGSISPIIEFKAFNDALSDKYKIVTIEPFGYGFSDEIETERTLENVVTELQECTKKLGIEKYYLMGHSVAGLYSLEWANKYPDEVLGFIGLDSSVPGQEDISDFNKNNIDEKYDHAHSLRVYGFSRIISFFNKKAVMNGMDYSYKYSDEELKIEKLLAINEGYSDTFMNEKAHIFEHLSKLKGKKFPENVPVLNFVASDNTKDPLWEKLHYDVLSNNTQNEVITLESSHYIYIDQKDKLIKKIKEWIN